MERVTIKTRREIDKERMDNTRDDGKAVLSKLSFRSSALGYKTARDVISVS